MDGKTTAMPLSGAKQGLCVFLSNHVCDLVSPLEGRARGPGGGEKRSGVCEGGKEKQRVWWEGEEISDNRDKTSKPGPR